MSQQTTSMRRQRRRSHQLGMSLIEVLTSVLIFSLGILGLMSLQTRALQFSTSAEDTNRAALLANEIATEMLTARNLSVPTTTWQERVASPEFGLPNGSGEVAVDAPSNTATITVTWRAPRAAADDTNRFVTQVVLP